MLSISPILAFAGLASLVTAGPAAVAYNDGTFSIEQVAVPRILKRAGSITGSAPTTELPADPNDTMYGYLVGDYLLPVQIGSQSFMLQVDTARGETWVMSDLLPAAQSSGRRVYNTTASKQKKNLYYSYNSVDGYVYGNVYADRVTVGGATATSQSVGAATDASRSPFFSYYKGVDGVVGLSLNPSNDVGDRTNVGTLVPQKSLWTNIKSKLKAPLFTATLKKSQPGTFDFGFIDECKYTGSIAYTNVVDGNYGGWVINSTGYAIGSGKAVSSSGIYTVSTGIPITYADPSIVDAYYQQVPDAVRNANVGDVYSYYRFPCNSTLPSFSLIIGGKRRTVPGSYLNYAVYAKDPSTCVGGLQWVSGVYAATIGESFLKGQFVVFDESQKKPRIGFAQQAGVEV